jgi:outer membrane protein insertion porin family
MKGNTRTRDEVLRREMRQLETAWFSTELVKKSRERLKRLGYFEDVNIETPAVPGSADQVDVNVAVTEKASGNLMAGVGYSQSQGVMFNASITQNNFLGSGKRLVFAFNNSQVTQLYRLSYDNPYYTVDGISRGFDMSYQTTDFDQLVGASYTTDVGVLGMNFGLPITDTSRAGLGLRYQNTKFNAGTDILAQAFVLENGTDFNDFILTASYTSDTRDTAIFPTDGNLNTLLAEVAVPGSDLTYYRLTYRGRAYVPLTGSFTFAARGDIGYGDGYGDLKTLPFFENFFAGGPNSVRGWEASRLGPVETGPNYAPVGGNLKITGSLELFAPPPVDGEMAKTIRLGVFFDFGNVWETYDTTLVTPTGFNASDIRYSTGVSVAWLSPVGALSLSLAYPLNEKEGDQTQAFQFTFGQTF